MFICFGVATRLGVYSGTYIVANGCVCPLLFIYFPAAQHAPPALQLFCCFQFSPAPICTYRAAHPDVCAIATVISVQAYYERLGESPQAPKFFASSAANVSLSVMKDKAFARMFGTGEVKALPFRSYGADADAP